jgi:hypothetical protein
LAGSQQCLRVQLAFVGVHLCLPHPDVQQHNNGNIGRQLDGSAWIQQFCQGASLIFPTTRCSAG